MSKNSYLILPQVLVFVSIFIIIQACETTDGNTIEISAETTENVIDELQAFLDDGGDPIAAGDEDFGTIPLTANQAEEARKLLWQAYLDQNQSQESRVVEASGKSMRYEYSVFGNEPAGGHSLYISLHGGGGGPTSMNDEQWVNQQSLYEPDEGVYVAPRAPTDNWNLWHEAHIDDLLDALILKMIVDEDINPNRVYLLGYSAGGDGVYQLAPRMADRWAAASMMAGHPNDARPESLRNVGFSIYMGGQDSAYDRNLVAQEWKEKLQNLQSDDPQGYEHHVEIFPQHGHWMNGDDAAALPWMAQFERNPRPTRIVWRQDGELQHRSYWLGMNLEAAERGTTIVADIEEQQINIEFSDVDELAIMIDDRLLDLDRPVEILSSGTRIHRETIHRTIASQSKTLAERGDPELIFSAILHLSGLSTEE